MLEVVLVHNTCPDAMEQNHKYFHSSWEQCTHAVLNTGMNSKWTGSWETHRRIRAHNHLPLLIASVTFSGLSRSAVSAWCDGMRRWRRGATEPWCQKEKVLLITPDQNDVIVKFSIMHISTAVQQKNCYLYTTAALSFSFFNRNCFSFSCSWSMLSYC